MNETIVSIHIVRLSDLCTICTYWGRLTTAEKRAYEDEMKTRVGRITLPPLQRQKHTWKNGCFFLQSNSKGKIAYILGLKDSEYPERWAFAAIQDIIKQFENKVVDEKIERAKVDEFSSSMKKDLRNIITKYKDVASIDKVTDVNGKVENCKIVMQDNIKKMLENRGDLEQLETKASTLATTAESFQRTTGKVESTFFAAKWKWIICLALILLGVLAYIIYAIVAYTKK